jgi:hypothetical protein
LMSRLLASIEVELRPSGTGRHGSQIPAFRLDVMSMGRTCCASGLLE